MSADMYRELWDIRSQLEDALTEHQSAGMELAQAENAYQRAKHQTALLLKAEGYTGTLIDKILKGDDRVATPLFARDCAQVRYDAAREKINALKLSMRVVEAAIERDWQQARRM